MSTKKQLLSFIWCCTEHDKKCTSAFFTAKEDGRTFMPGRKGSNEHASSWKTIVERTRTETKGFFIHRKSVHFGEWFTT